MAMLIMLQLNIQCKKATSNFPLHMESQVGKMLMQKNQLHEAASQVKAQIVAILE